jgi:SmpA/OmlA family protein
MTVVRIALLALACAAAGCANFSAIAPGDSAQSVADRVGAPTNVWKSADGSEVWEYPLGPLGTETYMVTLGPDRAVREVRQVLNDANISKLKAGMQRDEVRRLIGRPGDVSYSGSADEEIWYWHYRGWNVRKNELYVQFDRSTGALKSVTRYQIDTSDGKGP